MSTLNNVLSASGITYGQYIVVRITPDEKQISAWVVDPALGGPACPPEPLQALRSTSATTITNAINGSLPTLGT